MPDTIFYHLNLKRGRRPQEVFEKMAKAIKKRGATKNWSYTINEEEETFLVDFGDELSEGFGIHFEKQVADDCCKVYFPLDGELYEDEKKSEFKALLNMIYSARTSFSRMEITDDYGLAEDFMESKKFKLKLRELTEEEMERAKRLYNLGYTAHPGFVLKLIYDYLEIPFDEEYEKYVNQKVSCTRYDLEDQKFLRPFIETFLYETSEYRDQGRLFLIDDYFGERNRPIREMYSGISILCFSV